jgi:hypothetical protein
MLAFGAACDFAYHASFFVTLVLTLSGINFIRLELCYWVQTVPTFALFSSVWVVLFVGLDRLLSVIFPLWWVLKRNYRP